MHLDRIPTRLLFADAMPVVRKTFFFLTCYFPFLWTTFFFFFFLPPSLISLPSHPPSLFVILFLLFLLAQRNWSPSQLAIKWSRIEDLKKKKKEKEKEKQSHVLSNDLHQTK
eukprot:TRINITY_DN1520_c4_g1_i1.p1 TRINITY_DN1520_c4_g1~~TRINITY_DN1520_c4_g1_i1.p1  ORF type:complete len:112 (-),score=9.01 TRINITY_DN1520_c4_g1_i1:22-357(-)